MLCQPRQVGYEALGCTRSILEAAAAKGFSHVSTRTLNRLLDDNDVKVAHSKRRDVKFSALLHKFKDTWSWSDVDIARALMQAMPEHKQTRCQHSLNFAQPDEPEFVWDDLPSICAALKQAAVHHDVVEQPPCPSQVDEGRDKDDPLIEVLRQVQQRGCKRSALAAWCKVCPCRRLLSLA